MPDNDPLRPHTPSPFHPPTPEPYTVPERNPSLPPPFVPPGSPNPVDPRRDPWQIPSLIGALLAVATLTVPIAAHAAVAGGGTMPWSPPLTNIRTDLTGPTAGSVAMVAAFASLAVLIFGHEINHFVRWLVGFVMAASTLVALAAGLAQFGIAGATIDGQNNDYMVGFAAIIVVAAAVSVGLRARYRLRRISRLAAIAQ